MTTEVSFAGQTSTPDLDHYSASCLSLLLILLIVCAQCPTLTKALTGIALILIWSILQYTCLGSMPLATRNHLTCPDGYLRHR